MAANYYKCVKSRFRFTEPLRSAIVGHSCVGVEYKLNEWVYAPSNTKLFVFNDYEAAAEFGYKSFAEVFQCEVKNPRKAYSLRARAVSTYIDMYWKLIAEAKAKHTNIENYLYERMDFHLDTMPDNTFFCDAVKLIK